VIWPSPRFCRRIRAAFSPHVDAGAICANPRVGDMWFRYSGRTCGIFDPALSTLPLRGDCPQRLGRWWTLSVEGRAYIAGLDANSLAKPGHQSRGSPLAQPADRQSFEPVAAAVIGVQAHSVPAAKAYASEKQKNPVMPPGGRRPRPH